MLKKICVIFVIVAAVSADMNQLREECKTELNIPQESIDKYKMWNFDNDDHAGCYIECVFKKMGLVSNGDFNVEAMAQRLVTDDKTTDQLKTELENCIDNTIEDNCEKVLKAFSCFKANNLYRIKAAVNKD